MRTASRFAIVIVVLVIVLGGIFGYKFYQIDQMKKQMSQPKPPAAVEAVTVKDGTWQQSLKSVGSVTPVNGVRISNEVPGVIKEINFESGDRVKEGTTLLKMDTDIDEAAVRTRRAETKLAQQKFDRFSDLLPKKAVSQSQFDEAQANLEVAKAQVNEAEATLNKKVLSAPFAGTLGIRLVDQGEYMPTGTPIVEINMLDPIYVDYTISEKELANVKVGHKVNVAVAASANKALPGKVTAINSSVNPDSRTVRVRATLSNPDRQLQPGMFATVKTVRPTDRDIVYIPRTALSFNTYGDFVYVIEKNDQDKLTVKRRDVKTGPTKGGNVAITENLKAGERVVAAGLLRLRSGQSVQITSDDDNVSGDKNNQQQANDSQAAQGQTQGGQ